MHPVVEQIREICEALPYRFADGISYRITRLVVGRPAIFIGDQPGQDKLLSKVMKDCSVCWAPFDELDHTDKEWSLRDRRTAVNFFNPCSALAAECFNDAGEVIYGKQNVPANWDNRTRFGSNAILELVDLGFVAHLQLPCCFHLQLPWCLLQLPRCLLELLSVYWMGEWHGPPFSASCVRCAAVAAD